MEQITNPPFCYTCHGLGLTSFSLEEIQYKFFSPKEKTCKVCNGTGINLKLYDLKQYSGEIVYFEGRLGIFISQIHRKYAQILVGSNIRMVSNENILFLNLRMITPTRGDLFL